MVLVAQATSTRSNESSFVTMTHQYLVAALIFLGTVGIVLLSLPKVSSFSLSSAPSKPGHKFGRSSTTYSSFLMGAISTEPDVSSSTRSLMESQAGGNSSNRRRRKHRIRNSDDAEQQLSKNNGYNAAVLKAEAEELPEALVSFDSVQSVRLMDSAGDEPVRVELVLRSDGDDSEKTITTIDPRDLHQTSDFDLWMALRKHVVDVSASQVSVVLGTNYFTSRDKLLQDKIKARFGGSSGDSDDDIENDENEAIILESDSDEDLKHPTKSNSKACAWGIKMEPLAFAQYSGLVEATNASDDDDDDDNEDNEEKPQNSVTETGMYLLKHEDPNTKRTFVFGASPDGLVTEHHLKPEATTPEESVGLLEIKSLWGRRNKKSLPVFDKCPSRFYDQIQGQLAICDKKWCDLMLFIPPGDGSGGGGGKKQKRKGKSAKKRKKQAAAAAAKNTRKANGKNYSIVRVKRNETYWNEKVLPELIKFCDEVEAGVKEAKTKGAKEAEEKEIKATDE
eukprot:CAMPEP_0116144070 /NCGR_PEP_ID=MMETSP0329-20121206/15791_1 /TAXON_ID=697910 /ORGANISM="Pseudo-nitzschia arenysensis, Strain B593" /LENGTH=506 /DNA_ID=CAMNT_0003639439 /DNA_START=163 /DNA_END=1683 /DNA_ORIENTATION=+